MKRRAPPSTPATLHFDSTYAQQIITEQSEPTTNIELVKQARSIYRRVSTQRLISWNKVVAHFNNHGNEYADFLAGEGSKGHQTKHPLLTDWCWRCGTVFSGPSYARQLAGHEAYCKVPGAPPPSLPCRKIVVFHSLGNFLKAKEKRLITPGSSVINMKKFVEAAQSLPVHALIATWFFPSPPLMI